MTKAPAFNLKEQLEAAEGEISQLRAQIQRERHEASVRKEIEHANLKATIEHLTKIATDLMACQNPRFVIPAKRSLKDECPS